MKKESSPSESINLDPSVAVYNNCHRSDINPYSQCGTHCGRLIASGIWLCEGTLAGDGLPMGEWIGFETCLDITQAKDYYIGYGVDNAIRIYIDDVLWKSLLSTTDQTNFRNWRVEPFHFEQRKYKLRVEFFNQNLASTAGVEIYNNTYSQLSSPDFGIAATNPANILFSTLRDIAGRDVQAFRQITPTSRVARYTCSATGQAVDVCNGNTCGRIPINRIVNPYVKGYAGNWRPKETKAYQVNRKYADVLNPQKKGVELKSAGALEKLIPYWFYDDAISTPVLQQKWKEKDLSSPDWVSANTITLYDKYGQELENKDPLGRYSAATFVFRGDLPGAIASNARNREIYTDGFEDYKFRAGCLTQSISCRKLSRSTTALSRRHMT